MFEFARNTFYKTSFRQFANTFQTTKNKSPDMRENKDREDTMSLDMCGHVNITSQNKCERVKHTTPLDICEHLRNKMCESKKRTCPRPPNTCAGM